MDHSMTHMAWIKIKVNLRVKMVVILVAWMVCWALFTVAEMGSPERLLWNTEQRNRVDKEKEQRHPVTLMHLLWQSEKSSYHHVWPELKFGWRIVLGTIIGFLGAALGTVGGVGGGGIFVPMLALIIGFDPKSSTALSKCMIMGAAGSAVYYNLKLKHPTIDMPLIDYDLALLFSPMLILGISVGVTLNLIFSDWMVTILLIVLFMVTSVKAFFKGLETWKKETIMKKEAAKPAEPEPKPPEAGEEECKETPPASTAPKEQKVPILKNIDWKAMILLALVWGGFLAVQIVKTYAVECSIKYWVLNSIQLPIAVSVSTYEAISLYKGTKGVASTGKDNKGIKAHKLLLYCFSGVVAGTVGGLLGLGGGFILGPLFLEMGIPPQVASATSTFAMLFSSSMSVVEYYLVKRFPVPYAAYFISIALIAALIGQHVVRKIIAVVGRASIIIFILSSTIFVSGICLGGVGLLKMAKKMEHHEYMGFENLCRQA